MAGMRWAAGTRHACRRRSRRGCSVAGAVRQVQAAPAAAGAAWMGGRPRHCMAQDHEGASLRSKTPPGCAAQPGGAGAGGATGGAGAACAGATSRVQLPPRRMHAREPSRRAAPANCNGQKRARPASVARWPSAGRARLGQTHAADAYTLTTIAGGRAASPSHAHASVPFICALPARSDARRKWPGLGRYPSTPPMLLRREAGAACQRSWPSSAAGWARFGRAHTAEHGSPSDGRHGPRLQPARIPWPAPAPCAAPGDARPRRPCSGP